MPSVGKSKCGACRAIDHKVVGPAFMDVSAKYKGDNDAARTIAASIKKGGSFG
jgi:cytochrome c